MRALTVAAAAILLSSTVSAWAQTAVPSGTVEAPPAEKKFCRSIQKTGSIMPGKRTCRTKQEWATIDAQNAAKTDDFSRRPQSTGITR
ncbi:hypothetical protein ACVWZA_000769 [Sphingomonas sp. UYAg733]